MAKSKRVTKKAVASNKAPAKAKAGAKKTAQAKKAQKEKRTSKVQEPIKVIVEVVIRNETRNVSPGFFKTTTNLMMADADLGGCPDNRFTYSFDKSNDVTILSLIVGDFKQEMPEATGNFTTCILDPNEPPSILVTVLARTESPGGRAALSLSLNGTNVFLQPRELDNKGHGVLGFMDSVKLPA